MADFAVQFRTAVSGAGSPQDQKELGQAVQEFQRLCEDYLYLENLNGASLRRNYPPQYQIVENRSRGCCRRRASSERNRLGLGDGPLLRLREVFENDVGVRVFSTVLPSRVAGVFSLYGGIGRLHRCERPPSRGTAAVVNGPRIWSFSNEPLSVRDSHVGHQQACPRFREVRRRLCSLSAHAGCWSPRRFNELSRAADGKVTAAEVCRVAHYYFVSVEAMMLRLEELRLLPGGTWDRLRDRGFKVREAQAQLGLLPYSSNDRLLPLSYQFLAVRAYEEGNLTEGELVRLLRVDRVSARQTVQRLTHLLHLLDEGVVESLPVDLAINISGQDS